jgi:hypothetical protein
MKPKRMWWTMLVAWMGLLIKQIQIICTMKRHFAAINSLLREDLQKTVNYWCSNLGHSQVHFSTIQTYKLQIIRFYPFVIGCYKGNPIILSKIIMSRFVTSWNSMWFVLSIPQAIRSAKLSYKSVRLFLTGGISENQFVLFQTTLHFQAKHTAVLVHKLLNKPMDPAIRDEVRCLAWRCHCVPCHGTYSLMNCFTFSILEYLFLAFCCASLQMFNIIIPSYTTIFIH